jgi:NitT/TauT family transport system substrate-binding protein
MLYLPKFILVAALAVATTTACGRGEDSTTSAPTKVSLTLNWYPYGEHAPFYYGIRKGIFADHGIDLEIRPGKGSGNTVLQVAQQKSDFGWADAVPLIKGAAAGMKVKSIGVFLQKGPSSIEFFADKKITKPSDLKGKTVGGTPGDSLNALFPAWLAANGMVKEDVRMVDLDPAAKISALAENKVDSIMGFFHDQAPTIENRTGRKVSYLLFADSGVNVLATGLIASEDILKEKPDVARRLVKATQRAWAEAARDMPGAVEAMVALAEQEPPKEVVTKQLALAMTLVGPDVARAGVNDEAKWTETIGLLAKYAGLQRPDGPAAFWDATFALRG